MNRVEQRMQGYLQRHWQLHGHMLRHTAAFQDVLHAATSTIYLNRSPLRPGRPIRYNAFYAQLHDDAYVARAAQRPEWATMARMPTPHMLNTLGIPES
eukprot:4519740-Amphidinium_carterae.1